MSFEIEGKVHKIFDTESKTETFQAREFVIQTDGQYPQFIKFQLTQDKCQLVDGYSDGQKIKVYFDLRGREWNEKFFTNLNAWKVEKLQEPVPASGPAGGAPMPTANDEPSNITEDFEDLPF